MHKRDSERKVVIRDHDHSNGKVYREIIDVETGEIIKSYWIAEMDKLPGRPERGTKAYFVKLYRTNWRDIVSSKKLTPYEIGVFSMLLAYVDWQSPYIVHPKTGKNMSESEIATILNIDRSRFHVTVQGLVNKGLVAKVSKGSGRESHFMLNTNICFHGNTIRDVNDHNVFAKDCAYKPALEIRYRQSQNK